MGEAKLEHLIMRNHVLRTKRRVNPLSLKSEFETYLKRLLKIEIQVQKCDSNLTLWFFIKLPLLLFFTL